MPHSVLENPNESEGSLPEPPGHEVIVPSKAHLNFKRHHYAGQNSFAKLKLCSTMV